MKKPRSQDTIVVGGLHKDDYEWASRQYEALDYVFAGFVLDVDGYHWKAIYMKACMIEKETFRRPLRPSLRLHMFPREAQDQ